ncbi:MAG: hypothetical protein MUD13_07715 [Candidatus Nanopelagicales bacterium]|nr:hypothetical protein [Candidatus Nanopelagicales bacterium]
MRLPTEPGSTGIPRMFGSSPMITRMVRPSTNPVTIGLDRNSASQPIRSTLATMRIAPAASAMADPRATASAIEAGEKPAMSDPASTATVDTGPTMSSRDVPSRA